MSLRITESQIRELVFAFYDRVRMDEDLGPVFTARLAGRWDPHLDKMCDFWSSILLATGRFRGNPLHVHANVEGISSHLFDRWIDLFDETANEKLPQPIAADVVVRARNMRVTLERVACPSSDPSSSQHHVTS